MGKQLEREGRNKRGIITMWWGSNGDLQTLGIL